jgi:putative peptidoglycan lipid II flippase
MVSAGVAGKGPDVGLRRVMAGLVPVSLLVQACSFVSSIALARVLGASNATDAYYLGLSVPVLAYGILLAALRLGAIPALTDSVADGEELDRAGSELFSGVLVASVCLIIVVTALTEAALPVVLGDDGRLVSLTRLTVLELSPLGVLGALSGVLSAILAVRRVFALPIAVMAFEPVLKTLLTFTVGHRIGVQALIVGNLLGSSVAVVALWERTRREGIHLTVIRRFDTPFVRSVALISGPLLVSQSVLQVNPVVDRTMASNLGKGSVTALELGLRLFYVPSTLLLGALVGPITATWAARRASGGWVELRPSVTRALAGAFAVLPPLVVLGIALRRPLVAFVYSGGAYSSHALHDTTAVFGLILIGLPAQLLVVIFATLFIVEKDTVLPMKIALANVILNVGLNFAFRPLLGSGGIALSTSLTFSLLLLVYAVAAHRRWGRLYMRSIGRTVLTVGASLFAVGGTAFGLLEALPDATTRPSALLALVVVGILGLSVHAIVLLVSGELQPPVASRLGRLATRGVG